MAAAARQAPSTAGYGHGQGPQGGRGRWATRARPHLADSGDPTDASNELAGTPGVAGSFVVRLSDYTSQQATQRFSLTVDPPLQISTISLATGAVGVHLQPRHAGAGLPGQLGDRDGDYHIDPQRRRATVASPGALVLSGALARRAFEERWPDLPVRPPGRCY